MAGVYTFIKSTCLRHLPDPVLRSLKARHYLRTLRTFTLDQEPDLAVAQHLADPGDTVLDVGANVGIYTKVLSAAVGEAGRVVSVEPVPQTFEILARNVRALGLENVTPLNVAVSDRETTVTMEVPRDAAIGENFYQARVLADEGSPAAGGRNRRVRVRARTLDSVAEGLGRVAFVKCDVEGHELACMAGARATLRRDRPAWLVEVSGSPDESGSAARELFDLFAAESYSPWLFDGTRLRSRGPGDSSTNYFFLTGAHVETLRARVPGLVADGGR